MNDLNKKSEELLLAVKMQNSAQDIINELAQIDDTSILTLKTDPQKLAFWINMYNAFYQILAVNLQKVDKKLFKLKSIHLGTLTLSLDDIEHGILRRGMSKLSLGYVKAFFKYVKLKKYQPTYFDCRIHFALNCGAKSCPPIAFYRADHIDAQLDLATKSFIGSETKINFNTKTISTTRLFLWYYYDFGGKKGILKLINSAIDLNDERWKIQYNQYSWNIHLHNFSKSSYHVPN